MESISRRSWLYRWAYLFVSNWRRPDEVNVCALFWRCVLLSPLKVSPFVIVPTAFGWLIYMDPWGFMQMAGITAGVVTALATVAWVGMLLFGENEHDRGLLGEYIHAKQQQYCKFLKVED
jgi:hypothetical protein